MSGFQDIAAAIGIAELALRSISRIHDFVKYMKDAPATVSRLCTELLELKHCLSELTYFGISGSSIQAVVDRLALPATVNRCGDICSKLEVDLERWTKSGGERLISRLKIRLNRTNIETAIKDISCAKDSINLAISISSLRLQEKVASDMASDRQRTPYREWSTEDIDMPDAPEITQSRSGSRNGALAGQNPAYPAGRFNSYGAPSVQRPAHNTSEVKRSSQEQRSDGRDTQGQLSHRSDVDRYREWGSQQGGSERHSTSQPDSSQNRDGGNGQWDMEWQNIRNANVSGSYGTMIGVPANMRLREQTAENPTVKDSFFTSIGRPPAKWTMQKNGYTYSQS